MRITDFDFVPETDSQTKKDVISLVAGSATINPIFEEWFLVRKNRIGMSFACDEDNVPMPEVIAIYFDTHDGVEVGSIFIPRDELVAAHPEATNFDTFLTHSHRPNGKLHLHEEMVELWLQGLGYAANRTGAHVGPESAAVPLMVSFALSRGGMIEAIHMGPGSQWNVERGLDAIVGRLDRSACFSLVPCYCHDPRPNRSGTAQTLFDPLYCYKSPVCMELGQ